MEKQFFGFDFETFISIVDNVYDGIIICDNNYNFLYSNKACERQYGMTQEEITSTPFMSLVKDKGAWNNPLLPAVYKYKVPMQQVQRSNLGLELLTIAIPIFSSAGILEYVILTIRDNFHEKIFPNLYEVDEKELLSENSSKNIIYCSEAMQEVVNMARKVATVSAPCLLLGETGSGKSFLAKYIHENSPRKDGAFVAVNCAAIPEHLFESELFGHVKGAFSGAMRTRKGLFAKAHEGTLFLDEISEMPLAMQSKLLHAVEEQNFRPVGTSQPVHFNVRILTASNRDLGEMSEQGTFRQDLFYRLNVFGITIPPLRERQTDILPLFQYFINSYSERYRRGLQISASAQEQIKDYAWPGNVRELGHLVERLLATVEGDTILPEHLPSSSPKPIHSDSLMCQLSDAPLDIQLDALERNVIRTAYAKHGSTRNVAKHLGISQSRAARLIRKYVATK